MRKKWFGLMLMLCLLMCTAFAEDSGEIVLSFVGDCSIGDAYQYEGSSTSYLASSTKKGTPGRSPLSGNTSRRMT